MSNRTFQDLLRKKKKEAAPFNVLEDTPLKNDELREGPQDLEVELDQILPFEGQARKVFEAEALEELASSIRDAGVTSPIILLKVPGAAKYQVVSGERRIRASRLAGRSTIPARVCTDLQQAEKIAFFENDQRENLHPIERGYALKRLLDQKIYASLGELAKVLKKDKGTLAEYVRYAKIEEELAYKIIHHNLRSKKFLREISKIEDFAFQRKCFEDELIQEKLREEQRLSGVASQAAPPSITLPSVPVPVPAPTPNVIAKPEPSSLPFPLAPILPHQKQSEASLQAAPKEPKIEDAPLPTKKTFIIQYIPDSDSFYLNHKFVKSLNEKNLLDLKDLLAESLKIIEEKMTQSQLH